MRLTDLPTRRIFFTSAPLRSRHRRSPDPNPCIISLRLGSMADKSENPRIIECERENKISQKSDNPTTPIPASAPEKPNPNPNPIAASFPPPPEKPLPGDCCGSGCVRCVWDVYYEELEEYNRLQKAK